MTEKGTRSSLSKYLAHADVGSRRKVVDFIKQGLVMVNGAVITEPGHKLTENDLVEIRGKPVTIQHKVYILLNKPKDYITTVSDERDRKTVMDLLPQGLDTRVYPVGRLDRTTTGLLLLTNDGSLAQYLAHPRYEIVKGYHVLLNHPLKQAHKAALEKGIMLEDGKVMIDEITYVPGSRHTQVEIMIHSGKNRVIRRLFEALGYEVKKLDRFFYAGLTKKKLPIGTWRYLTDDEVTFLTRLITL